MEQKTGQPKAGVQEKTPRPKFEEVLARNPGLVAVLSWELRHNDAHAGYGH